MAQAGAKPSLQGTPGHGHGLEHVVDLDAGQPTLADKTHGRGYIGVGRGP